MSVDDAGRYPALGTRCRQSCDCSTFFVIVMRVATAKFGCRLMSLRIDR